MKKIYMTPSAEAIKIQTTGMLAMSVTGFDSSLSDTPIDAGGMLGHEDEFDFDDEFDDEYNYGE